MHEVKVLTEFPQQLKAMVPERERVHQGSANDTSRLYVDIPLTNIADILGALLNTCRLALDRGGKTGIY